MYDINLNYLVVRSQESGRKKEEERVVEGESCLFALLSGQDIIPLFTNTNDFFTAIVSSGFLFIYHDYCYFD
ncbi:MULTISPECIES: hypothetical protein [Okeania]|uniref:hypothetical protein n=1 Tax=Okeania TaxID=1458928 RepID=UPI000F524A56|nr:MULTISPECIES: hypothetical protein [Okeania]NET15393.1 hypothetical protein [Okeania sp. SIO1H6]NEP73037.1 hypothetical protein [Okeania sp. SIO2G5]NEP93900.1 hypothetical protein [Okeania sp. SIO2F5]NEQ91721.1 hypothetical protein [Okeania sp. SIO2G4]NES91534.1 hypothetical protein [Okeania sp. SIO2B9]